MKRILNIGVWVLLTIGLLVSLGFAGYEQSTMPCSGVSVLIDHKDENFFVDEADIQTLLADRGDTLVGQSLSAINYDELEQLIMKNPVVEDAEVYADLYGKLNVQVKQRTPLVRVFNDLGESFYIDEHGQLMPLSEKYTARVIVANGFIKDSYHNIYALNLEEVANVDSLSKTTLLDDVYLIAKRFENDEFWSAQIQQIYVDESQEIVLIPRVGNHKIILGDRSNLERKLKKLMIFYEEGLNKTGWNQYSVINLKYKNQVVCTKR